MLRSKHPDLAPEHQNPLWVRLPPSQAQNWPIFPGQLNNAGQRAPNLLKTLPPGSGSSHLSGRALCMDFSLFSLKGAQNFDSSPIFYMATDKSHPEQLQGLLKTSDRQGRPHPDRAEHPSSGPLAHVTGTARDTGGRNCKIKLVTHIFMSAK